MFEHLYTYLSRVLHFYLILHESGGIYYKTRQKNRPFLCEDGKKEMKKFANFRGVKLNLGAFKASDTGTSEK